MLHGQVAVKFDLMYDQEESLFNQEKRLLPTLAETRWTSRTETLTWLFKHSMTRFLYNFSPYSYISVNSLDIYVSTSDY
jgi:hypothetical protein